jgi:hypothetical protein
MIRMHRGMISLCSRKPMASVSSACMYQDNEASFSFAELVFDENKWILVMNLSLSG